MVAIKWEVWIWELLEGVREFLKQKKFKAGIHLGTLRSSRETDSGRSNWKVADVSTANIDSLNIQMAEQEQERLGHKNC